MRPLDHGNAVRIQFLNKDGTLSEVPRELDMIPVIQISIGQQHGNRASWASALALIDTGADHRAIDRDFAKSLGFQPAGTASPSGIGGVVQDTYYYELKYAIAARTSVKNLNGNFVSVPLAETGRQYQVILGMSFLQKGRLIMDAENHDYFFEFSV